MLLVNALCGVFVVVNFDECKSVAFLAFADTDGFDLRVLLEEIFKVLLCRLGDECEGEDGSAGYSRR
jgi:hypothetical protein